MDDDRNRKRARYQHLLSGIEVRRLQRMLDQIPGCETASRHTLSEANHLALDEVKRTVELERLDGGRFDWVIAEPNLLLAKIVAASPELQEVWVHLFTLNQTLGGLWNALGAV